jgi:hypothetical protein
MDDFNAYVKEISELDKQEAKTELENYHFLNLGLLQFFKAIDNQMQVILNSSTINPKSVELIQNQVNSDLPVLKKLKYEINMLDTNSLSMAHKDKINKTIDYIKDIMVIGEVDTTSNQFFALLKENETAIALEKEQKEREEAERKAKAERERKEREEAERKTQEEKARRERVEKEHIAREEAKQKAKEEEERQRIVDCSLNFYNYFFKSYDFPMFNHIGKRGDDYYYLKDKICNYLLYLKNNDICFDQNNNSIFLMPLPDGYIIPYVSKLTIRDVNSLHSLPKISKELYYFTDSCENISIVEKPDYGTKRFTWENIEANESFYYGHIFIKNKIPFLDLSGLGIEYKELLLENINIYYFPKDMETPKNHKPKITIKNCLLYWSVDHYFMYYDRETSPFELVLDNVRAFKK